MHLKQLLSVLTLALAALLLLSVGCNNDSNPASSETQNPENTLSVPTNEDVTIETPYCDLTIPYAFSELVSYDWEKSESGDSYVFSAVMEERNEPVYAIRFVRDDESSSGQLYGTIKADDGTIRVLFEVYDADESLTEDELESFYSAQETINDVFTSLQDAQGFTAS